MENKISPSEKKVRLLPLLRRRVNSFLREPHIKKEQWLEKLELYSKAFIMFTLWLVPFVLMFKYDFSYFWDIILGVISGIGMAGVGMNVMHDASHGAFSKYKWVNKVMAASIYVLAGNVYNWRKQHVEIHHTHTNIDGMDDDIDTKGLFRFSEKQKWRWGHRFQFLYAIPFYSLMTILWISTKDFFQMQRYFRNDTETPRREKNKQYVILVTTKLLYWFLWIVLPLLLWNSWIDFLCFFFAMHLVCGFILTIVFQLAHVVPKAQMYEDSHDVEDPLKHQLLTSVNFATENLFLNWYLGGLNLQKEHHVFPDKNHVQYRKIKHIVRDFCKDIDIPYTEYRTMIGAVWAHFTLLYQLGNNKTS